MKYCWAIILLVAVITPMALAEDIGVINYGEYVKIWNQTVIYGGEALVVIPGVVKAYSSDNYFVVYGEHDVHVFNALSMKLMWSRHLLWNITNVVIDGGYVVVGTINGYAIYDIGGDLVESRVIGGKTVVGGVDLVAWARGNTSYAFVDGTLHVYVVNGSVEAVSTGWAVNDTWYAVYRVYANNTTYTLVLVNGSSLLFPGDPVAATRCWNMVCAATRDTIVAFNSSGDIVWSLGVAPGVTDVDSGNNMLWIATHNGLIGVMENGRIGYYQPGAFIAVDAYGDYVYALRSDGKVYSDYAPSQRNLYVVHVVDKNGNPVVNATVRIGKYENTTNENGVATIRVPADEDPGVVEAEMGKYSGRKQVTKHYFVETTVVLKELVYGELVVDVEPLEAKKHARILVVGEDVNHTTKPGETIMLPVGKYNVTVTAPGYEAKKFTVDVKPGRNDVTVRLSELKYDVYVIVLKQRIPVFGGYEQGEALLYVDDTFIGRVASLHLKLTPGKHTVTAKDNFYLEKMIIVNVGRNGTTAEIYLDYEPGIQALFVGIIVALLVVAGYGLKMLVSHVIAWLKQRRELVLE